MILHANCVAIDGFGVLIKGASGSGKSALSLQLMALGASLVSDDRTLIETRGDRLWASCPATLRGMIEARGVGILQTPAIERAALTTIIDMDVIETQRLPETRETQIAGISLPVLHKVESYAFPASIVAYIQGGKVPL